MKKYFMTVCAAVALLSCAKEVVEPIIVEEAIVEQEEQEAQPLVFNFQINHASMDEPGTKAVKTGWEAGDVVYVFFSGIAAPKHVELTYDGSAWTSKQIRTGKTEGSIGLTTDGTMTAVYLPFGNDAVVKTKSSRFGFDQIIYSYYLSCVNAPYTISGDVVSGTLDMSVPDGFVQFFYTDADATDEGALLREAHITPKAVTGVNTDGTLVIESKDDGTQMPGYVYGTGAAKGYLFSGELADAARGVSTDYHFNMVVGATSKVLEGTKTLHSGTVGNYAHRAIKFPAISSWSDGSNEIIEFADANIKTKVVDAFDTSGDGELSYAEAAAATSISGVFGSAKNYKSFDEFQFFTGVTSIPDSQFMGWNLKSIKLPEGLHDISYDCFLDCVSLNEVVIPNGVTVIHSSAFGSCSSLTKINIPSSVTSIEYKAFYECSSLPTINIPDGVTSIGGYAFYNCSNLSSTITIPNGVSSIEYDTFYGCSSLTTVIIPDNVTSIGYMAFYGCSNLSTINIPDGMTNISDYTFYGCSSLSAINVPDGVTSIGNYAFCGCSSLTAVDIPESVISIGEYAFAGCSNLPTINIPDGVTEIRSGTFSGCSGLASINIPDEVISIGSGAFNGCSTLTTIIIPDGVTSIGSYAFYECSNLITISIPDGVTSVDEWTFFGCSSLMTVDIPDSVISIGEWAFASCCSLSTIVIPDGVTEICYHTFGGCSNLASISFPDGMFSIRNGAFAGCSALSTIIIPDGVTSIGYYAFSGCSGLSSITILSDSVPDGDSYMFYDTNNCPIYVPGASVDDYKAAEYWDYYASRIQAIP